MTAAAERLCVFASPHADDAKGATARTLREAGLALWVWPPAQPQTAAPAAFDALVIDSDADMPPAVQAGLIALLRQAWVQGATIGLFGHAVSLLHAADIAAAGAPVEAPGLFTGDPSPGPGTLEELVESIAVGPHTER